ncbi:MAG: hypothetical protein LBC70_08715 [Chitinispirillales bacterium]|jgi:phosphodiesterase/alkaline phosphatase D-like protein|nr:hypothetical protein [Chitinispirillales bacterium]
MTQTTISVNEIQPFISRIFGSKKITAITAGNTVVLTADAEHYPNKPKKDSHTIALNKLCGMFKGTNLLSSDDFAKNKIHEKQLEEKKFNYE